MGGKRVYRNQRQNKNQDERANCDESNPVILCFKEYAKELEDKHDRYERIIKQGRDVTIESKRIIFLLHTIDPKKEKEKILKEAENRLRILIEVNFENIAKELGRLDQYQYSRAYSPGLQEFVEAFTFHEYLSGKQMSDWHSLQQKLKYTISKTKENDVEQNEEPNEEIYCLVQPVEYILGLADVSGEIMRRCINSLGSGDIDTSFESCRVMQALYSGYLAINCRNRELSRKIYTLRQSVLKTENVCYNVKVRGGEAAKWGAESVLFGVSEKNFEDDEGVFLN